MFLGGSFEFNGDLHAISHAKDGVIASVAAMFLDPFDIESPFFQDNKWEIFTSIFGTLDVRLFDEYLLLDMQL